MWNVECALRYLCSKGIFNSHFDADKNHRRKISFEANNNKIHTHTRILVHRAETLFVYNTLHICANSSSSSSKWNSFISFAQHCSLYMCASNATQTHQLWWEISENVVFHRHKNAERIKMERKQGNKKNFCTLDRCQANYGAWRTAWTLQCTPSSYSISLQKFNQYIFAFRLWTHNDNTIKSINPIWSGEFLCGHNFFLSFKIILVGSLDEMLL